MTYEEVVTAANELQQQGINPTVDSVRKKLGRGSNRDITPLLKQWKLEELFFSYINGSKEDLPKKIIDYIDNEKNKACESIKIKMLQLEAEYHNNIDLLQDANIALHDYQSWRENYSVQIETANKLLKEKDNIIAKHQEKIHELMCSLKELHGNYISLEFRFFEHMVECGKGGEHLKNIELIHKYKDCLVVWDDPPDWWDDEPIEGIAMKGNIGLATERLIDLVYKEARLEGISVAIHQMSPIYEESPCPDLRYLPPDDIIKISNLFKAWQFVCETVGYPVTLRYVSQINWEVGRGVVRQAGDLRTAAVAMGGTSWKPELPDRDKAEARIATIRDSEATVEDKAIDMMLYLMRAQLFADGNKRTAQIVANQMLISGGIGIQLAVPVERIDEFTRLLVRYYETEESEVIKAFIRQHCVLD